MAGMVTCSVLPGAPDAEEATGVPSALNTCRSKSLAGLAHWMPILTMSPELAAPTVSVKVSQVELLQLGARGLVVADVNVAEHPEPPHHATVVGDGLLTVPDEGVAPTSGCW